MQATRSASRVTRGASDLLSIHTNPPPRHDIRLDDLRALLISGPGSSTLFTSSRWSYNAPCRSRWFPPGHAPGCILGFRMVHTNPSSARPRRVAVLGSTGSIGTSALDVIRHLPDRLELVGLAAHSRWEQLAEQCREFKPRYRGNLRSGRVIAGRSLALPARDRTPGRAGRRRQTGFSIRMSMSSSRPWWARRGSAGPGPRSKPASRWRWRTRKRSSSAARSSLNWPPGAAQASCRSIANTRRSSRRSPATPRPMSLASCSRPAAARFAASSATELESVTPRTGTPPSDLADGAEDHGRFRDAHEQGARSDRGTLAFRTPRPSRST